MQRYETTLAVIFMVRFPAGIGEPIHEARLVSQPDGPAWIITAADGGRWRYSAVHGTATPKVGKTDFKVIRQPLDFYGCKIF